jgi:GNAT superfamily N-acetyltransferase
MSAAPALRLSQLTERHAAAVQALHVRSFEVLARESYTAAQVEAYGRVLRAAAYVDELLACGMCVVFDEQGEPVATAGWSEVPGKPDTARIRKVFVDPAHARRGLAGLLVVDAERRARRASRDRFVLRSNLNAVPLYRHLGYVETETDDMTANGLDLTVQWMHKPPTR